MARSFVTDSGDIRDQLPGRKVDHGTARGIIEIQADQISSEIFRARGTNTDHPEGHDDNPDSKEILQPGGYQESDELGKLRVVKTRNF
jgi:hypothetical protein